MATRYDRNGNEVADKCVGVFGSPLGSTAFGAYNQVIGDPIPNNVYTDAWLQGEWSNVNMRCVFSGT